MRQTHAGLTAYSEAFLITLFRSTIPEGIRPARRDFVIWGSSNFLNVDSISSLSEISLLREEIAPSTKSPSVVLTERRYLCLYHDLETYSFIDTGRKLNWIFEPHLDDYPLIIITLIQSTNLYEMNAIVKEQAHLRKFEFELFQTLGHSKGALVIRCKSYAHALESIVQLNTLNETTYSIAGVQNPLSASQPDIKKGVLLFSKLQERDVTVSKCSLSINYRLKQSKKIQNRVLEILSEIKSMSENILNEFEISENELNVRCYYEIGRYDIEVRIEGVIAYALELLLSPKYGLTHKYGNFSKKYISESRTTWETPAIMSKK